MISERERYVRRRRRLEDQPIPLAGKMIIAGSVLVGILLGMLLVTLLFSASAEAQDVVYCQKMGDFSGQVYTFQGSCPFGYYPV